MVFPPSIVRRPHAGHGQPSLPGTLVNLCWSEVIEEQIPGDGGGKSHDEGVVQ